jgi:hypothetical protein
VIGLWLVLLLVPPILAFGGVPDHAPVVFMNGEVVLEHIDEVMPEQSRMAYFLQVPGANELVEMIFENGPPRALRTGSKVQVKGPSGRGKLWVSEIAFVDGDGSEGTQSTATTTAATTGSRQAIVMLLNMTDAPYAETNVQPYDSSTVTPVGQAMFALDQYSVNSAYQEASLGQLSFPGSASADVFVVWIPYDNTCAYRTMSSQADSVAPVDLSGYQHKVYLLPPSPISGCTWIARGEVGNYGSTTVRKSWSTRVDANAFAHELGHNLGWHHAATDTNNDGTYESQYGDKSDLMGSCCSKRKVNSVHVDQIGWYDAQELQAHMVNVTAEGQYTLALLGTDPGVSSDPQILKIAPTTGRTYYLSYRQKTGQDSGMSSTYTTGVNIHRGVETDRWSYLVKVLKTDFSDPQFYQFHDPDNAITITQIENNANYVTVDISFDTSCVLQSPQVTFTPGEQTVSDVGQVQPYTIMVTNQDMLGCDSSQFNVALDSVLDANGAPVSGITGTVQDSTLSLGPGDSGSTILTVQVSGVADASYTVNTRVSDAESNDPIHSGQATASLQLDTTPPAPPSNLAAQKSKSKGKESVKITWSQASDGGQGSGVVSYNVYRNGVALGSTSNLSYTDAGFPQTSSNDYEVYAVDAVGHVSSTPGTVVYTYSGGDRTKPGGKGNGRGKNK